MVPPADRGGNRLGFGEPHAPQRLQGFGIGVGVREHQIAAAGKTGAERRRIVEQLLAMLRHTVQMPAQRRKEGVGVPVAEEGGDARQLAFPFGQAMGLPVLDHLQAVLDAAQIPV